MHPDLYIVVEGELDKAVALRLAQKARFEPRVFVKNGRTKIEAKLNGYVSAASNANFFVLVDLDDDKCPQSYLQRVGVANLGNRFILRIAVRALESWILADSTRIAATLSVTPGKIPLDPDELENPKRRLIEIVRHYSRSRQTQADLLPVAQSLMRVGPGYTLKLSEFIRNTWDIEEASKRSPSLRSCLNALHKLRARVP